MGNTLCARPQTGLDSGDHETALKKEMMRVYSDAKKKKNISSALGSEQKKITLASVILIR